MGASDNPGSPYSARSVELYTDLLDRHVLPLLGASTKAAAVTAPDLRLLINRLNAKRLSGSSVHGILTATSALLRFAVRRGVIDTNPCRLLERGDRPSTKRRREPRYLNRSEIDRLLDHLGDEFRPVAAMLAFAGPRVSEALALRWQDVDFDARMLHVPGTKPSRAGSRCRSSTTSPPSFAPTAPASPASATRSYSPPAPATASGATTCSARSTPPGTPLG